MDALKEQQHVGLKPAVDELQLRLAQIQDLLPALQLRARGYHVEDFSGLVAFFTAIIQTEKPRPSYDDLVNRATTAIAVAALKLTDGNKTEAAEMIGLSRYGFLKILNRVPGLAENTACLLKDKQTAERRRKKK